MEENLKIIVYFIMDQIGEMQRNFIKSCACKIWKQNLCSDPKECEEVKEALNVNFLFY